MKVLGYIALHYGKDYLAWAIRSMYSNCDQILVLYSPVASHGSSTSLTCPDTEQELIEICANNDPDNKIVWKKGNWRQENEQRNVAHYYGRLHGFHILVCTDADEVWDSSQVLGELINLTYIRKASKCLVWMRHLWRSFNYVCDDPMRQERIYYLGDDRGELIYAPMAFNQVWHFGYARRPADILYKISIHGHSAEWLQPKEQWFHQKYMPFPPANDTHPVCKSTWNPQPFDKTKLPELMQSHPWYNKEVINV